MGPLSSGGLHRPTFASRRSCWLPKKNAGQSDGLSRRNELSRGDDRFLDKLRFGSLSRGSGENTRRWRMDTGPHTGRPVHPRLLFQVAVAVAVAVPDVPTNRNTD